MNRMDFMGILEAGLAGIPEAERNEALQYYNDYLNDAGVENEQEVMESLGPPEQVAASIKAGLAGEGKVEFTEQGYRDGTVPEAPVSVRENKEDYKNAEQGGPQSSAREEKKKEGNSAGKLILIIAGCILVSPVVLSVGAGLLAAILGLAGGVLSLWAGLVVVGVAALFAGLAMVVGGIIELLVSPVAGALFIGVGLLLSGLGLLVTVFMIWLACKIVPALFRGCAGLCRRIFKGKGAK